METYVGPLSYHIDSVDWVHQHIPHHELVDRTFIDGRILSQSWATYSILVYAYLA